MKAKKSKVCIIVTAIILVIVLALNIAVGVCHDLLDLYVVKYKSGGNATSTERAAGAELSKQIQEEGTVLVKNDNNLLPLNKSIDKVNVFGWASVDWVISGSGSGTVKPTSTTIDLLKALDNYGIEYNKALTNMYTDFAARREFSTNGGNNGGGSLHSFNYEFSRLYEPSINNKTYYSDQILSDANAFSNTAIVVIGRTSGESNDSPKVQYKKTEKSGSIITDTERTYLEISTEEEELLTYVGSNFENVIVLINSTNVMELGFMETIDGLDSCLVVATTGSDGADVIPALIYGEKTVKNSDGSEETVKVGPTGKLADTYAYDLSTSSTYVDTGSGNDTTHFYTNGAGLYPTNVQHTNGSSNVPYEGVAYEDYRESIYVGYKWYETADTMGFWNSSYAKNLWNVSSYDEVVQYPFGYGLSYTDFEWEVVNVNIPTGEYKQDDQIELEVKVTNVGEFPGQDIVELYFSAPYTAGGIEKSSVNLGAFAKTQNVLQPGESELVTLTMDVSDMASYDYSEKIVKGGGYVLEDGTYTLTLRTDAHTLAGKKVKSGLDTFTYSVSKDTNTDENATNRFTGDSATDGVAIDGNSDGSASITYLSRENFTETFPEKFGENRAMTDAIKKYNLYNAEMASEWANQHSDAQSVTFGDTTQGGIVGETQDVDGVKTYVLNDLGMTIGKDYNAEEWEGVLNRITKEEMQTLVLHGYIKTREVNSIGKPQTQDLDGPNQIGSFAGTTGTTGFSSIVLAQTWNTQLAYSMGLTFGAECAANSITGWYGPGVNIHRSPFGGRNYEYYSEDTLISGIMCANVVTAAKNKGVYCWLKHICLYESESGRDGMYTWLTEQALREIYLKPFEIAVKKGNSTAIMTSYGRIGAVWTGGSEALLSKVVRGEWGFKGSFLTDYADHHDFMNGDQMLRAGGDLWMDGYSNNGKFAQETTSNAYNQALRSATKNILYTWANALATSQQYNQDIKDGKINDTITIPSVPELNFRWYIPVLIAIDVIALAGCGLWIFFSYFKKDNKDTPDQTTTA